MASSLNRKCATYRNAARGGPSHGNMHKKLAKIGRMLADIQTDRQTQTRLSQYAAGDQGEAVTCRHGTLRARCSVDMVWARSG